MSAFSKNLRFLRKRGNHNQDEIALLFNKRSNTVGNWENQKSEPNLTELIKLAAFFRVSTEDLLNIDIELSSSPEIPKPVAAVPAPKDKIAVRSLSIQEPMATGSKESNPDAFWLILRELRVIGDKLDSLVSGIEPGGFRKNSDKSYH
jgi:DNA-binding XRE family transcriptional regulator